MTKHFILLVKRKAIVNGQVDKGGLYLCVASVQQTMTFMTHWVTATFDAECKSNIQPVPVQSPGGTLFKRKAGKVQQKSWTPVKYQFYYIFGEIRFVGLQCLLLYNLSLIILP